MSHLSIPVKEPQKKAQENINFESCDPSTDRINEDGMIVPEESSRSKDKMKKCNETQPKVLELSFIPAIRDENK